MAKITHDTAGWEYELRDGDELRQRDVEAFFHARRNIQAGIDQQDMRELSGVMVGFIRDVQGAGVKLGSPDFTTVFREFSGKIQALRSTSGNLAGPEKNGLDVRTAIRCEWLTGITESEVDDLHPAAVTWLASEINEAFSTAYEIPGE